MLGVTASSQGVATPTAATGTGAGATSPATGVGTAAATITVPTPEPWPVGSSWALFDAAFAEASSEGRAVDSWADSSGNARNATQATLANRPLWYSNQIGGYPVMRFDGVNDYFTFDHMVALPMTLVMIVKKFSPLNGDVLYGSQTSIGSSTSRTLLAGTTTGWRINNGADVTTTIKADFDPHIFIARFAAAGTGELRIDGQIVTGSPSTRVPGAIGVIGSYTPNNLYANMDLAAMAVYNRELTAAEMDTLETYAASRFGLTVV